MSKEEPTQLPINELFFAGTEQVARAIGPSLHAVESCEGHERTKRERPCRYIARPAAGIPRLSLSSIGKVVCTRKTP